jgi:sterol desaturase/sphingolipid hydroxylase (fatty acid hydroxylase superfamily)
MQYLHARSPRTVAILSLLLFLFFLRVLGQGLVSLGLAPFLPPMEAWYSGLLPYGPLLACQLAILAAGTKTLLDLVRGKGLFSEARPRLGRALALAGRLYLAAMAARYVLTMSLHPERRWWGEGAIASLFHGVLALFLIVLGGRLRDARFEAAVGTGARRALSFLVYPGVMAASIALFFAMRHAGAGLLASTYAPVALGALAVMLFERLLPYRREWSGTWRDARGDAVFLVLVQMLFPKMLAFLAGFAAVGLLDRHGLRPSGLWPHAWPLGLQLVLMILVEDLFRYWLHRSAHEHKFLWRFHAVHHSPKKLYWLNVGRFHPVDKGLQFLLDTLPFVVLGVSPELMALYFVFYGVNGFFQHCNIDLRLGWLNAVFSSPELHRWHHSRKISESNHNYGNNTILWDWVFGTRFHPRDREVGALGLLNPAYPEAFGAQMRAPFSGDIDKHDLPLPSPRGLLLNLALKFRMRVFRHELHAPFLRAARDPAGVQEKVLLSILRANASSEFGKKHGFGAIRDAAEYRERVPLHDYEALRPWIERQELEKTPALTAAAPVMYNQTSGTTGLPKYIPVLPETLEALRRGQRIFACVQYQACPEAFHGSLLGLVSPAIEGRLETGTPYGSASGHLYKSMPRIARAKYALPPEVFEIPDPELKYAVIARLAAGRKDVTYLAAANPSSFHKLLDVVRRDLGALAEDVATGSCRHLDALDAPTRRAVRARLKPDPRRAAELRELAARDDVSYATLWPWLKLVATWTGGSCGISLNALLPKLPAKVRVAEVGYLASELRGTLTVDIDSGDGIPTLQENFFEFVERGAWERGEHAFLGLEALRPHEEYYVFVTTPGGLYRYPMNDIVRATGTFAATPTLRFVQKGRGVTNITGEKLYESHLLAAMERAEGALGLKLRFWTALAHEEESRYELHAESEGRFDADALARFVDAALREHNLEYAAKRAGGRLAPLRVRPLRAGAFEAYKAHHLARGQREGQFKPVVLQYKRDLTFALDAWSTP